MNKYRKKYQNVVEKKNHLAVISKDHNTIDSLESQALDAFYVQANKPEHFMQRMGQLYIKPMVKRRYKLNYYQNQAKLLFPSNIRKIPTTTQTLDRFLIKPKEKQKNIVQKPVFFNIFQHKQKTYLEREQLDNFICLKKEKPELQLENVHNVMIEKSKIINNTIQSLNQLKLPASGKFFNGKPTLKSMNIYELEYLKIKAPLKSINSTSLYIPLKPKKTKFTDVEKENSSNLNYILKKVKVFTPQATQVKNMPSLLIPKQPKKTSFQEISQDKASTISYTNFVPKKTSYDHVTIENFPDIFIPDHAKRRYLSAMNIENMSIPGDKAEYCLEIDPNEEIFIPNVYDMLLIQNFWDDLEIRSFRFGIKPFGYSGKSSRNLAIVSNKNLYMVDDNKKRRDSDEIIERKEENEDNEVDKDVLISFRNLKKDKHKKGSKPEIDINIYEDKDKDKNEENKENLGEQERPKGVNKKVVSFKDLKDKLRMLNND